MMDRIREKQSFFVFSHPVHPASEANPVITLKILSCTEIALLMELHNLLNC
jgi:hypothetical protein